MPRTFLACTLAWLLASSHGAGARANALNPDISAIGDTRATWSEAADDVELAFSELEIGVVGPVNPYARAEVFAAIHGTEGIELEEAKLLLDRYLPAGLGLTIGRYLLDFGQLNSVHAHAYPFVDRPLMHSTLFGPDGLRDIGVRLDWLAPTDAVTLRAAVGALRGDVFLGVQHGGEEAHAHARGDTPDDEEAEAGDADPEIGVSGRLELFAEPSRDVALSVGASVLAGEHDTIDGASALWIAPDIKARIDLGPRSALILNAEAVFGSLDETEEAPSVDPNGWFVNADLRPAPRWNVGAFAESTTERSDDDVRTVRFGGFVGFSLLEESTLFRVLVRHTDPHEREADTAVLLQALFGLGPHAPHRY